MEITYGKQIDYQELQNLNIDLFMFAINHEKRVFSAYDLISSTNIISKSIALCYNTLQLSKIDNIDSEIIESDKDLYTILDNSISKIPNEIAKIVIDYSCMTKSWYYLIMLFLTNNKHKLSKAFVYFIYTPSKFSPPREPKFNKDIAPLPGKCLIPTDKPKALFVCLGYEQNKAEGIIDHLDPKLFYVFYTKPALDDRFVKAVEENNRNILNNLSSDRIVKIPMNDLRFMQRELEFLYYKLRDEYNIIIAPLGPKPFTFISMLMSMKYKDIDIWRVGSGYDINKYEREPFSDETFIISEIIFEKQKTENKVELRTMTL